MSEPSLEERKSAWLWNYAHTCFQATLAGCDFYERESDQKSADGLSVLFTGLVVTYAKPFTRCHGVGALPLVVVPPELLKYHEATMDFRNKLFAHLDAANFVPDDSSFGNLNRVTVEKNGLGKWVVSHSSIEIAPLYRELRIRELAEKMLRKADYYMDRFNERFVAARAFKPGRYILNVDPADTRAFIRISRASGSDSPGSQTS